MIFNLFAIIHSYFPAIQENYFWAIFYFLILFLVFKLTKTFALTRYRGAIKEKGIKAENYAVSFVKSIRPWFYLSFAFWIAVRFLDLPILWGKVFDALLVMAVALQIANVARVVTRHLLKKAAGERAMQDFSGAISFVIFALLILAGVLFVLSIFGVNVSTLIAGLGFGGIAFALATQKVFSDLFCSVTIFLDRSFAVGDFIVFGGEGGKVEKIGWRSTKLKAESGEEIIIANSALVAGKVNNYKKQEKRRGVLSFNLSLENKADKLEMIHKIISESAKEAEIEIFRASFTKTTSTSLVFEVIYFGSQNQDIYFNSTEKFLLKVKKRCEDFGLSFA